MDRICSEPGCNKVGQHTGKYRVDGTIIRRAKCAKHHSMQYRMSGWEYKIHRKDYCENKDGRLGYTCTATIVWEGQLTVDHINGVHTDNREENLQTLCANCHNYKTYVNQDWLDKTEIKLIDVAHPHIKKKISPISRKLCVDNTYDDMFVPLKR